MNDMQTRRQRGPINFIHFDDGFYCKEACGERTPKIGCSYRVWQNVVLHGLLTIHFMGQSGAFHADPILPKHRSLRGIPGFDASSADEHGRGFTDHVIDIHSLWQYVSDQLTRMGIYFEDGDSDCDPGYGYEQGYIWLSSAIVDYLGCLAKRNCVIDLNTRLGFNEESSYKLGVPFDRFIHFGE